ncbi:MAG: Lrp/AsnC family transcriptional regulator [Clostridia bacterium]|nr:Lrp/AsnC family transcriptional regulator [Clostridia bacterium]
MDKGLKNKVLSLIEGDARLSKERIAVMLDEPVEAIAQTIEELENDGVVLGYKALVDWDKTDREYVTALIELKVTPQRDRGFEKVAERISNYPEVKDMYLMSGAYDYCVIIEGKTMKQVALFVAEKLATIENVISTSTHFVLRKYKNNGVSFGQGEDDSVDERGNIN